VEWHGSRNRIANMPLRFHRPIQAYVLSHALCAKPTTALPFHSLLVIASTSHLHPPLSHHHNCLVSVVTVACSPLCLQAIPIHEQPH
jgi:hypothetical protein